MSNTSNSQALSDVIVVVPVIRIWSGQVTLRRDEDLNTASGLPPKTLVSDGGKRVIDPKALTVLETQRRCVNRDLAQLGIKSPMGFLISPEREKEVHEEMERRRGLFENALGDLIASYDRLCTEWESANPGFESFLRRNRTLASDVQRACSFTYATYRVAPVDSDVGKEQFEEVAKSATHSLVEDIASNASAILKESFDGKEKITQRTVGVVRELVRKLRGFSMFDPRILPTADALDKVLSGLPKTGSLDTIETLILRAMVKSMTDADQLLKIPQNVEEAQNEVASEPVLEVAAVPAPSVTTTTKTEDPAERMFF